MFHKEANQTKDPFRKNPGVDGAISDTPPDMRLKPPMRGEVDHRPNDRRNQQFDQQRVGNWSKPNSIQGDNASSNRGNVIHSPGNTLSRGDYGKGMNPNSSGDFLKSKGGRW